VEKAGLKANTDPAGGAKAVPSKDTETAGTQLPDYPGQPPFEPGAKAWGSA